MTITNSSLLSSWCFLVLLLWGCTAVAGLVNTLLVQPTLEATPAYNSSNTVDYANDTSVGNISTPFACGNTSMSCGQWCSVCMDYSGAATMDCLHLLIRVCHVPFQNQMDSLNDTERCIWAKVKSSYNNFTVCTETMAECLNIPWPNPLVEQIFVEIHSEFFRDCPSEELSDPPPSIVLALVMTPICLIPVMVILVVLKTKNGDGSS